MHHIIENCSHRSMLVQNSVETIYHWHVNLPSVGLCFEQTQCVDPLGHLVHFRQNITQRLAFAQCEPHLIITRQW